MAYICSVQSGKEEQVAKNSVAKCKKLWCIKRSTVVKITLKKKKRKREKKIASSGLFLINFQALCPSLPSLTRKKPFSSSLQIFSPISTRPLLFALFTRRVSSVFHEDRKSLLVVLSFSPYLFFFFFYSFFFSFFLVFY